MRRRQGQLFAVPLAQTSQALEELAVPAAEAPLMLREFIDPLPGGHTVALPGACAPLSRAPVITPGLVAPGPAPMPTSVPDTGEAVGDGPSELAS